MIGYPDGAFNPANGFPLPIHAPPGNPPYQSIGPAIIGSACVVTFLVLLITGTRLSLRYFRKYLKIECDYYVIISAALGVVSWFSLAIVIVVKGGAGQHIYDITYMEVYWFYKVSSHIRSDLQPRDEPLT